MAAQPILKAHTNNYVLGRGSIFWDEFDAAGNPTGEVYLGNSTAFEVTVGSEVLEHFSSESGIDQKDDEVTLRINSNGSMTTDDISDENLTRFTLGTLSTVSQAATPVTGEIIGGAGGIKAGAYYQLGQTTNNPTGVRGVSSVTITIAEGANADTHATTTAYVVGDVVVPSTPNDHFYMCSVAGTSGGSAPTWKTDGTTNTDGTVTWRDMGTFALTVDDDYLLDTDLGRFQVNTTGVLATAISRLPSGQKLTLEAGYTPTANSRTRISAGTLTAREGRLRYLADNPKGTNRDLYATKAKLTPNGALAFKTGNNWMAMQFNLSFSKPDVNTPALYIDGRPVA